MSNSEIVKAARVIGEGSTQLYCETHFNIDPPLKKVLEQRFEVVITEYTVFVDKVMFKGFVEKSLIYKHPHLKKKYDKIKEDKKKDKKKDYAYDNKSEETDKADTGHDVKKNASKKENIKKDELNCTQGWCVRVDSNDGIVHFYEEVMQFAGAIEISGVLPGDICDFTVAEVRDYEAIVPTEIYKNGLVKSASQMFIINVEVSVTRPKKVCVKTEKKCDIE